MEYTRTSPLASFSKGSQVSEFTLPTDEAAVEKASSWKEILLSL